MQWCCNHAVTMSLWFVCGIGGYLWIQPLWYKQSSWHLWFCQVRPNLHPMNCLSLCFFLHSSHVPIGLHFGSLFLILWCLMGEARLLSLWALWWYSNHFLCISIMPVDARYDLLHNAHLKIKGLDELYKVAKVMVFSSFENTHFLLLLIWILWIPIL